MNLETIYGFLMFVALVSVLGAYVIPTSWKQRFWIGYIFVIGHILIAAVVTNHPGVVIVAAVLIINAVRSLWKLHFGYRSKLIFAHADIADILVSQ